MTFALCTPWFKDGFKLNSPLMEIINHQNGKSTFIETYLIKIAFENSTCQDEITEF
jgi:hypothetical protein